MYRQLDREHHDQLGAAGMHQFVAKNWRKTLPAGMGLPLAAIESVFFFVEAVDL
jgi:hypothetical protein